MIAVSVKTLNFRCFWDVAWIRLKVMGAMLILKPWNLSLQKFELVRRTQVAVNAFRASCSSCYKSIPQPQSHGEVDFVRKNFDPKLHKHLIITI